MTLTRPQWNPGPTARVDWSHPLAQGLVLCCPDPTYDLAYGVPITPTNNPGHGATPFGPARTFVPGSSTFMAIPAAPQLQIGGSTSRITVSAWAMRASTPGAAAAYSLVARDVSGTRCFTLDALQTTSSLRFYVNGSATALAAVAWPAIGAWFNVVGTWSSTSTTAIWLNGAHGQTTTSAATPATSSTVGWQIGAREFVGFRDHWDGTIGPVQIWNRVLSANEIAALYADPFCMLVDE